MIGRRCTYVQYRTNRFHPSNQQELDRQSPKADSNISNAIDGFPSVLSMSGEVTSLLYILSLVMSWACYMSQPEWINRKMGSTWVEGSAWKKCEWSDRFQDFSILSPAKELFVGNVWLIWLINPCPVSARKRPDKAGGNLLKRVANDFHALIPED